MSENVVQLANQGVQSAVDDNASDILSVYDPVRFSYQTPALEKLLEALVRSVDDRGILTVIKGVQGSGKTALLQQFLLQARPEWGLCLVQASHVIGEKHILEQLNNRYYPHNHYDIEVLADRLAADAKQCWPVVLIDDAHNLSSFALDVLLSLKFNVEEQGGRLGLILLALPSIQEVLSSPSLLRHDEVVRVIDMPALTEEQTVDYIDQLLEVSGLISPDNLSNGQKQAIYRRSKGLPGLINPQIYHAATKNKREPSPVYSLLRAYLSQPRLWAAAMMAVVFIYGVFSLLSPENNTETISDLPLLAQNEPVLAAPDSKVSVADVKAIAAPVIKKPVAKKTVKVNKPVERPRVVEKKEVIIPAAPAVPEKPVLAALTDHRAGSGSEEKVDESSSEAKPTVSVNQPVNGQLWLKSQNSGDYTIQLAASAYEDAIERFIRKQPVMDGLRYVHIVRRGKDWYVTLFGSYTTFAKAKQAIADLPATLRKNEPWIRKISTLQKMLPGLTPESAPELKTGSVDVIAPKAAIPVESVSEPAATASVVDNASAAPVPGDESSSVVENASAAPGDESSARAVNTVIEPAVVPSDSAAMPVPVTQLPE